MRNKILVVGIALGFYCCSIVLSAAENPKEKDQNQHSLIKKVKDIIIYEDPMFYTAFPSAVRRPDGQLIVAFRRAPSRRIFGEKNYTHTDANSYLVLVRSHDGETWTKEPELIYAHPFGGSQDPCLLQLHDNTLICTSYGWAPVKQGITSDSEKPVARANDFVFLGGYLLRSDDAGKSWEGPFYPPCLPTETVFSATGDPLPSYNRGALCESANGRIFWIVAGSNPADRDKTSVHLIASDDNALTWKYMSTVATDEEVTFNETSVYETPKGDIVAFMRTANFDDQACIARSHDGGKSFDPWQKMGFRGHPLNALRLPDNSVLLTYGYRHEPYGIRARILDPECTNYETAPEIILRDDGGNSDIGYTWPVMIDKTHILVTYYFNKNDGTRYIAGTILKIE